MKVILTQDIKRFGKKGEVMEVKDGYATSYLIPKGLAKTAGAGEARHAQAASDAREAKIKSKEADQTAVFERNNQQRVTIETAISPSGKLYKAVTASDISAMKPGLQREHLQLKHGLKEPGVHKVSYRVGKYKGWIEVEITNKKN